MSEDRMEVVSTTVVRLGEIRVGIGNIYRASYRDKDDQAREGLVIDLHPAPAQGEPERFLTVGEGARFELAGVRWEVVAITQGQPRGSATLRRVLAP